jgi:flagellar basal-body rod protein FlgC
MLSKQSPRRSKAKARGDKVMSVSTIALSGALAASKRLDISANNTANARSQGALAAADGPEAFQPSRSVQTAVSDPNGRGLGTRIAAIPANPAIRAALQPDSPFANAEGLVATPDVDLARERIDQIASLRSFQANLALIRTQDEIERTAINRLA